LFYELRELMQINSTPPTVLSPLPGAPATRTSTAADSTLTVANSSASTSPGNPTQGAQALTIPASYTANAGGKSYSVSVEETGGIYVASVEVPPEASATGSSIQSAEASLDVRIDAMV